MAEFTQIKTKIENEIGTVTLAHPPVNAISPTMLKEIDAALTEFQAKKVRGIIFAGSGNNAFCAGADVKEMPRNDIQKATEFIQLGNDVFTRVENFPSPTICAINNLTLGGGLELALACDFRISSDRARFGLPEVTLGLIPSWGGVARLPRVVGPGRAKEIIFMGQMINAQEALRIGLLNKVVPDGDEVRAALDFAKRMSTKASPFAISKAKQAINEGLNQDLETALNAMYKAMMEVGNSKDIQEGITAFIEKRQPNFKGE